MQHNWMKGATALNGPDFEEFQRGLAKYRQRQFQPALVSDDWRRDVADEAVVAIAEGDFIEAVRSAVAPLVKDIPTSTDAFIEWFEELKLSGPGQGDPLFPWIEKTATLAQLTWFITQEVAGEAGFEDLLALTQVKITERAKLEMARNFWDEMGRGNSKGMHGPLLDRLSKFLHVDASPEKVVGQSLALGNMMTGLARNRRFAFQSIGALGAIEMTAPTRAGYVNRGLRRVRVPSKERNYFALHAILDVKHSEAWNREVLRPLVDEDPRRAKPIGEGALLRLWLGLQSFERYRREFNFEFARPVAA